MPDFSFPLMCPVCGGELRGEGKSCLCEGGHCFDIARQGYVNLLTGSRSGDAMGDSAEMSARREAFLSKGYFSPLADRLKELITADSPVILDVCCGEGYYSRRLAEIPGSRVLAFDLSKSMIRRAAKGGGAVTFFVANMSAIPVRSGSVDAALILFAPFAGKEAARVMRDDGVLLTVVPGRRHLFEMKEILYSEPYENDEKLPESDGLTLAGKESLTYAMELKKDDIADIFAMTPYYYHSPEEGRKRLSETESLTVTADFVIAKYRKTAAQ